jgi:hypothetical protein
LILFYIKFNEIKSNKTKVKKQEMMNCYAGLAKRIVKSCFPPVIPIPQLQPLDARNIIKHRSYQVACEEASKYPCERWKEVYGVHMNVSFKPKPLSAEEAWEAALIWAEVKAQERESATAKAASQTDTDESYDSDDSEVGVYIQPVRSKPSLFGDDSDEDEDEDEYEDEYEDDNDIEEFARTVWDQIASMIAIWGAKERAATIIQAAARGRAARLAAWDATYAALDAALLMRLRKERRRAAKEARRAWNVANDPSTWYRV